VGRLNKVTNSECEQIFFNRSLIVQFDTKHSNHENRYYALGITDIGRKLFVVFTVRNKKIHIISAKNMSRKKEKFTRHHNEENEEANAQIQ